MLDAIAPLRKDQPRYLSSVRGSFYGQGKVGDSFRRGGRGGQMQEPLTEEGQMFRAGREVPEKGGRVALCRKAA